MARTHTLKRRFWRNALVVARPSTEAKSRAKFIERCSTLGLEEFQNAPRRARPRTRPGGRGLVQGGDRLVRAPQRGLEARLARATLYRECLARLQDAGAALRVRLRPSRKP